MSRQVWKYTLAITNNNQDIKMPSGAQLIHVDEQGRRIGLWFEIDPEEPLETVRSFRVIKTGSLIKIGKYVGTVILMPYVWHVYEV